MSKKLILDYEEEPEYTLIGISSSLPDYRLLFFLNKSLGSSFKRLDEFFHSQKNSKYSVYEFTDSSNELDLYFLSNKSKGIFLFTELQMFDFLILVGGNPETTYLKNLNDSIRTVSHVQITKVVDTTKIKNYFNIIFELENHIQESKKINR